MKPLLNVTTFGAIDADNDEILFDAFEEHEALDALLKFQRFLVVGRKGSGKTAIFKKLLSTRQFDFFSFGHTFSDYPWHHHDKQARTGIPSRDKYTHSWKYLILLTLSKIVLNHDNSIPFDHASMERMITVERFVIDSYGSLTGMIS
jgi:septin family protein